MNYYSKVIDLSKPIAYLITFHMIYLSYCKNLISLEYAQLVFEALSILKKLYVGVLKKRWPWRMDILELASFKLERIANFGKDYSHNILSRSVALGDKYILLSLWIGEAIKLWSMSIKCGSYFFKTFGKLHSGILWDSFNLLMYGI